LAIDYLLNYILCLFLWSFWQFDWVK